MRKFLRSLLSFYVKILGTAVTDCRTGRKVGNAIMFCWGGRVYLLGYEGVDQVIPMFLPQDKIRFWNRQIGFTTHPPPDFPHEFQGRDEKIQGDAICYLLLAHNSPADTQWLLRRWQAFCREPSQLLLCYGGPAENFGKIDYQPKVFIDDVRLRTRDHQREKQSYSQIFKKAAAWLREHPEIGYLYLAEYDHWPLVEDLGRRLIDRLRQERADVLGHQLGQRDRTSGVYYLHHIHDERFLPWIRSVSRRNDPGVVMNMFGSGSFWTRDAFLAVAEAGEPVPVYLEMYLPTLAHHLGFRVRDFGDQSRFISAQGDRYHEQEQARQAGAWTLHPVKTWPS